MSTSAPDETETPAAEAPPAPEKAEDRPAPAQPAPAKAAPPKTTWRENVAWFYETYCTMEPRTAGLYRIVVGFLCATDAMRHWYYARVYYSNAGVLTNHYHLFRPSSDYNFSIYHAFSSLEEVHLAFALSVFVHLSTMVGWHARLFSFLSFILVTSLDNRLVMVENGGYVAVNLVVAFCALLPTDRRFSVDALLRSYRERKEKSVADLNGPRDFAWAKDNIVSLAVFWAVLNLAAVYFFNVVNKSGEKWHSGESVHYVLYLNRMVTGIAVFFRHILPMWSTRVLAWSVLCWEALLVPLILAPTARKYTRTMAMLGVWGLHVMFGTMFRLGPFAWFMIGWSFTLMAPEQWELVERWYRKRASARVVVLDRTSPLAFALGRLLARLDNLDLLTFEQSREGEEKPPLFEVVNPATDTRVQGMAGFKEICQALPGGRQAFWALRIGSLGLLGLLLESMSARRDAWARFFGLTLSARGKEEVDSPSPLRRKGRRYLHLSHEVLVVYLASCAVLQAIAENKAIPEKFRPGLPKFMLATLIYPRMFQGWGMFAPNPITDDGILTIDAITVDGRHVDPLMGGAPPILDLRPIEGMGLGQIPQDYANRIRLDRNKVYRQGLKEYLQRWHLETGNPNDELVAFDAYWVRAQCPPPGKDELYNNEKIALLTWRKPNYKPPPGLPPLPPEPKVESADTIDPPKPGTAPSGSPSAAPAAPPKP
ncbi:MAG: HTTM domain-containing protein [Byssovorax sp.]